MMMSVCYEVYVFASGRWVLDSTYPADQRAEAVAEARVLANGCSTEAVKVVEEEYDERRGAIRETTVFCSRPQRLRAAANATALWRRAGESTLVPGPAPQRPLAELRVGAAVAKGAAVFYSKLVAILLTSVGFASATTLLFSQLLA
jgi:hypothetical protein